MYDYPVVNIPGKLLREMIMIDRDTLEELLMTAIARGESLGYVEADDNYRQLLRDLRAAQQGLQPDQPSAETSAATSDPKQINNQPDLPETAGS